MAEPSLAASLRSRHDADWCLLNGGRRVYECAAWGRVRRGRDVQGLGCWFVGGFCAGGLGLMDSTITANRLACYVPGLRGFDDAFRLRVILHDFGMVWQDADDGERAVLAAEEPEPFDARWDAFLAAYVEHLCYHAGIDAPDWTSGEGRYLDRMWWPAHYFEFERGSVMLSTPAAFEVHGIWIAERELEVV